MEITAPAGEIVGESLLWEEEKRGRGRKSSMDLTELGSRLNNIRVALELHWLKIGRALHTVREAQNMGDENNSRSLRRAFTSLKNENPRIFKLLAETGRYLHPNRMRRIRKRISRATDRRLAVAAERAKYMEAVERADMLARAGPAVQEQEKWQNYRQSKEQAVERHRAREARILERRNLLAERLRQGEAKFAMDELINFCQELRYELTPHNIACALAGVPETTWRQSMKRCRKWEVTNFGEGKAAVLRVVQLIIRYCPEDIKYETYAAKRIKKHARKKPVASNLLPNLSILQEAFRLVDARLPDKLTESFKVTKTYFELLEKRTPLERLLADDDRIPIITNSPDVKIVDHLKERVGQL